MMNKVKNKHSNRLIVIEGLDGAGKSTQIKQLKQYLKVNNIPYKYIHFPRTDTPAESPIYGEMVANFLKGDYGDVDQVNPYLAALLYAGDRNNAKVTIKEWLGNGYFVILDRYVYSNMAFQGAKFNDPQEKKKLKEWIFHLEYEYNGIPKPTLSIYLHMNFEFIKRQLNNDREGTDRNYLQGKIDIHEKNLELQAGVEKEYLQMVEENEDFNLIECFTPSGDTLPPEQIHSKIIELLTAKNIL